jgi:hypothetical protein
MPKINECKEAMQPSAENPGSQLVSTSARYPLLESILDELRLPLQGSYRTRDAARIFGVSTRAIQQRMRDGSLPCRDLPGRARFLSGDLEEFIRMSLKSRRSNKTG